MRVLLLVAACAALSVAADARALLDAPAKATPDADPPRTNKKWVHQMNPAVASAGTTGTQVTSFTQVAGGPVAVVTTGGTPSTYYYVSPGSCPSACVSPYCTAGCFFTSSSGYKGSDAVPNLAYDNGASGSQGTWFALSSNAKGAVPCVAGGGVGAVTGTLISVSGLTATYSTTTGTRVYSPTSSCGTWTVVTAGAAAPPPASASPKPPPPPPTSAASPPPTASPPSAAATPPPPPATAHPPVTTGSGINYHNGLILDTVNVPTLTVHALWYGAWASGDGALKVLPALVTGMSNTPYWKINNLYSDFVGSSYRFATPYLKFGNQTFLKSGQSGFLGNSITSAQVFTLVSNAITTGALPLSSSAAYAVFTSQEIVEGSSGSSFCAQYCGYHDANTVNGVNIPYMFVGQPSAGSCYQGCSSYSSGYNTPNAGGASGTNGAAADAMASTLAHELDETATDPFNGSGWYETSTGNENGDKCAYNYGSVTSNSYNVAFSTGNFLIQQNWNPVKGACTLSP